jgi:hypothetical protein
MYDKGCRDRKKTRLASTPVHDRVFAKLLYEIWKDMFLAHIGVCSTERGRSTCWDWHLGKQGICWERGGLEFSIDQYKSVRRIVSVQPNDYQFHDVPELHRFFRLFCFGIMFYLC